MDSIITTLPREVLLNVFTLGDYSIRELGILARVCKLFQVITEDNTLWKPLAIKELKHLPPYNLNFKTLLKVQANLSIFQCRETSLHITNTEQITGITSQFNEIMALNSNSPPSFYELESGNPLPSMGLNPVGSNSTSIFFNFSFKNKNYKHRFLQKVDIGSKDSPTQIIGPFNYFENIFIFEEWAFGLSKEALTFVNLNKSVLKPTSEILEHPPELDRVLFKGLLNAPVKDFKCKGNSLLLILTNGQLLFIPDLCKNPRIVLIKPTIAINPEHCHINENTVILLSEDQEQDLQMETFFLNERSLIHSFVTQLSDSAYCTAHSRPAKGLSTSDFDGHTLAIGTKNCKLMTINHFSSEHTLLINVWNVFLNSFLKVKMLMGPICLTIGDQKFVRIWDISKPRLKYVKEFLIRSPSPEEIISSQNMQEEKEPVFAAFGFNGYRLHIVNSLGLLHIWDFTKSPAGTKRSIEKIESPSDELPLPEAKPSKKLRYSSSLANNQ